MGKWTSQQQWEALAPRPCIDPLRQLCAASNNGQNERRAIEHIVTMGSVTQTTLQNWGHADSGSCASCAEMGTPHHRCWLCPQHRDLRGQGERHYQHMGATASADSLFVHAGLRGGRQVPFHATPEVTRWHLGQGHEAIFENKVGADPSLTHKHKSGGARAAGRWSATRTASRWQRGAQCQQASQCKKYVARRVLGGASSAAALQPASRHPH